MVDGCVAILMMMLCVSVVMCVYQTCKFDFDCEFEFEGNRLPFENSDFLGSYPLACEDYQGNSFQPPMPDTISSDASQGAEPTKDTGEPRGSPGFHEGL